MHVFFEMILNFLMLGKCFWACRLSNM